MNRFPVFEFDREQTRRSRDLIERYLKATGAALRIQHDFVPDSALRRAPAFYDLALAKYPRNSLSCKTSRRVAVGTVEMG